LAERNAGLDDITIKDGREMGKDNVEQNAAQTRRRPMLSLADFLGGNGWCMAVADFLGGKGWCMAEGIGE
jgi:hypothetical protein